MANPRSMTCDSATPEALPELPDTQVITLQLQLARQLYDKCLERHGENHEQTRLVSSYISALEKPRFVS